MRRPLLHRMRMTASHAAGGRAGVWAREGGVQRWRWEGLGAQHEHLAWHLAGRLRLTGRGGQQLRMGRGFGGAARTGHKGTQGRAEQQPPPTAAALNTGARAGAGTCTYHAPAHKRQRQPAQGAHTTPARPSHPEAPAVTEYAMLSPTTGFAWRGLLLPEKALFGLYSACPPAQPASPVSRVRLRATSAASFCPSFSALNPG